jgi:hypothetical protein
MEYEGSAEGTRMDNFAHGVAILRGAANPPPD